MRNSYIVKICVCVSVAVLLLTACREKEKNGKSGGHKETVLDSSVLLLTEPVNKQVKAAIPVLEAVSGSRILISEVNGVVNYDTRNQTSISSRVAGRIERLLIRYNYQPVEKGQLIMEIYSPDLAAAQQELLYLASVNDAAMLQRAKEKLQLAGMQNAQIAEVLRTGKILYRVPVYSPATGYILERTAAVPAVATPSGNASAPASDGMSGMGAAVPGSTAPASQATATSPVLLREGQYVSAGQSIFTIYRSGKLLAEFAFTPALAAKLKTGQSILFYPNSDKTGMVSGKIGLIEPVFRNGENFTLARVYLNQQGFQAGQLLTASVPVVYRNGWWLPKAAVWMQAQQAIVFIRENNVFNPVQVRTGVVDNERVQVLSDLSGREIATNAYYMVDSESFIKVNQSLQ
ncbi:MAG: efflux RND transporter periplasmic adaptor subunit [Chitinophagaceae bacterium]|nr:efflux RND transporter periplasmic adaptor subunit [Chitinophagaceae bacterium]